MRSIFPSLSAVILSLTVASAQAQTEEIMAAPVTETAQQSQPAKPAVKAEDQGWNSPWALLFSFNNILVNGNFLSQPIAGTIGGYYYLSSDLAVRAGFGASRSSSAVQVTKVVNSSGGTDVTTYVVTPPGTTQAYGLSARADLLKRLMATAIAPYVGAGVGFGWTYSTLSYTDDKSVVDQRTEVDNNTSAFDLVARGIAGAEWRIHPNFAIFAEYNLMVTVFNKNRVNNRTTVENTVGGSTSTAQVKSDRDYTTWFQLSTGLAQGANLGLEVLF